MQDPISGPMSSPKTCSVLRRGEQPLTPTAASPEARNVRVTLGINCPCVHARVPFDNFDRRARVTVEMQ